MNSLFWSAVRYMRPMKINGRKVPKRFPQDSLPFDRITNVHSFTNIFLSLHSTASICEAREKKCGDEPCTTSHRPHCRMNHIAAVRCHLRHQSISDNISECPTMKGFRGQAYTNLLSYLAIDNDVYKGARHM